MEFRSKEATAAPQAYELVCATGWGFQERKQGERPVFVLEGLSDQQSRGEFELAGVDSCFLGDWVCGSRRFEKWKQALEKRGFEVESQGASGRPYRFGKGVSAAVATWKVPVQVGEMMAFVEVDVVRGSLPLLCGQAAQEQFALSVDGGARQVTQRVGRSVRVLDGFDRGQLPNVSVLPGHRAGEKMEYTTWVAMACESGSLAKAETAKVSVVGESGETSEGAGVFDSEREVEEFQAGAFRTARKTAKQTTKES